MRVFLPLCKFTPTILQEIKNKEGGTATFIICSQNAGHRRGIGLVLRPCWWCVWPAVGLRAQCRKPGLPAISPCRAPGAAPRIEPGSRLSNRPDSEFRTLGNTSPLAAERCHHPVPEFHTSRSRQRPRVCIQCGPRVSADLRVPTALPAVCPSLPGVPQVLPAPGPLLTRDTRACSSLRGLRETPPGPQPPAIFLRFVSQDLGGQNLTFVAKVQKK